MDKNPPKVSVCVCTFKRPLLLMKLLESISQQTYPADCFEVIVVDNDRLASAKLVVESAQEIFKSLSIRYEVEPRLGISFARNKTVDIANGKLLAFIDDDEYACSNWLEDMVLSATNFDADATIGPVIPQYPEGTPSWIKTSKFFERPRYTTGTIIACNDCRTGNALVSSIRTRNRKPVTFSEEFDLSGGEDTNFFKHIEEQGAKFIWCDTAVVTEIVPIFRQSFKYMFDRCFRTATNYWRQEYKVHSQAWALNKACTGLTIGLFLMMIGSVVFLMNRGKAVQILSKGIRGIARVAALTSINLVGYGDLSK